MFNYVINDETLAIIPYGSKKAMVIETTNKVIVNRTPKGIIRQNCILYGSCFEEKLKKTELLTGYIYKAPIMINLQKKLLFFPTSSPRLKDCSWINPLRIKNYIFDEKKSMSKIEFITGEIVFIPVSIKVIENQILRSTKLMTMSSINSSFI